MKKKVISYKRFKIQEQQHELGPLFSVYTKEEWQYGEGLRSVEWEACSMQEAKDFIDSYDEGNTPVTANNLSRYEEGKGFLLLS